MLVFEAKLEGEKHQYEKLDEAIPTARFVRNCCIKYWIENKAIGRYELSAYCKVLTDEFSWANKLNSMARQAWAENGLGLLLLGLTTTAKRRQRKKVSHDLRSIKHMVVLNTRLVAGSYRRIEEL